jgi:hypothetical protein
MATVSNVALSIVRDIANADVSLEYDINWSSFDQLTNVEYDETWKLIGDDTGQDGDDGVAGDDPISLGIMFATTVSSNSQTTTHRTKSKTIAWSSLNEDTTLPSSANDDEIRAVVTLTPKLPLAASRESNLVTVVV